MGSNDGPSRVAAGRSSNANSTRTPSSSSPPPRTTLETNVRSMNSSSSFEAASSSQNSTRSRSISTASSDRATASSSRSSPCLRFSSSMRSRPPGGAMPSSMARQMFAYAASILASSPSMTSTWDGPRSSLSLASTMSEAIFSRFSSEDRAWRTASATSASTRPRRTVRPHSRQR